MITVLTDGKGQRQTVLNSWVELMQGVPQESLLDPLF